MSAVPPTTFIPPYIPSPTADLPDAELADAVTCLFGVLISQIPARKIQKVLTRFQATPILGPLIGSPIKALYSTAQIIFGIALCVLFGPIATLTRCRALGYVRRYGAYHFAMGIGGLTTSLFNFAVWGDPAETEFLLLPVGWIERRSLAALRNRCTQFS